MKNSDINPPKFSLLFFRWFCRQEFKEDIEGDLMESFIENLTLHGPGKAKWLFTWDVIQLFRPALIRLISGTIPVSYMGMIKNYFKTSFRSMARNKLFTSINIIGLSVSMSVGLLMIALITDMMSYNTFHLKEASIYRVITQDAVRNGPTMNFASTSVKAGYKIRETIPGIEELTLVRTGFSGDMEVKDGKKVAMTGLWADSSFLNVFTFPMLEGDLHTALKDPYSIVLTEKSAKKMFGKTNVVGELLKIDTLNYLVTGVLEDVPKFSYIQFESLVSFSTVALQKPDFDGDFFGWGNIYMNYVYALIPENSNLNSLQSNLDQLSLEENNLADNNHMLHLKLQPFKSISIGSSLVNEMGITLNVIVLWVLSGLAFIVILSACFNYTNLSVARSMKRAREVGIRKAVGALRRQVIGQFIIESIIISLVALAVAIPLFLFLKDQLIALHPFLSNLVKMDISWTMLLWFFGFAVIVGALAGLFPAVFFSRIKVLQVLKGFASIPTFQKINIRKSLIVIQYVFSLIFITTTVIGYSQYKSFVAFDLGFETDDILNISLQGNKSAPFIKQLSELPEVADISQSAIITSLGSGFGADVKFKDPIDSISVWQNIVDENYLSLHGHEILSGRNFNYKSAKNEVIVNEKLMNYFGIGGNDPYNALGEFLIVDGKESIIVGVIKDFHYQTVEHPIQPFIIRYNTNPNRYINLKLNKGKRTNTLSKIEDIWSGIDSVHPLIANFYDDEIVRSLSHFSIMIKVIGYLSFLTIVISSLGLFGMVVFTTETKLKEISIRKTFGAREWDLSYLLGKRFLWLLCISSLIAIPITFLVFDQVFLPNIAYHKSIEFTDLFTGFIIVSFIAIIMVGSQTINAARINPAKTLQEE